VKPASAAGGHTWPAPLHAPPAYPPLPASMAGATAAPETGAPRATSRRGRAVPRPWLVAVAATAWPRLSRESVRAAARAGGHGGAAGNHSRRGDRGPAAAVSPPQAVQCPCRQGLALGWPFASRVLHPAQPSASPSRWGQHGVEVSTGRGEPRVGPMRGGGQRGGWGTGAWACSPAVQSGVCVTPGHGCGSRERFLGGVAGVGVARPICGRPRGLLQSPATDSHRRASRRTS
jgi:hypothetical protein